MAKRYQVFLSSPADVTPERDRAEDVLKRLNNSRVDQAQFEIVRWENEYYSAADPFQDQLPKPSECDLVISIFWKRLGTDLPPKYSRRDGTLSTGSEYEFEEALDGAAKHPEKLPDVLVYRKTEEVLFPAFTLEQERAQYERFLAFWRRWFHSEEGHFLAGFQSFASPDEFEALLEKHLTAWLQDRENDITWSKGSPYRGLEPFEFEHAAIFFGRRREVERARARLITSAAAGKPFLLIVGASGGGKSSLVRAGPMRAPLVGDSNGSGHGERGRGQKILIAIFAIGHRVLQACRPALGERRGVLRCLADGLARCLVSAAAPDRLRSGPAPGRRRAPVCRGRSSVDPPRPEAGLGRVRRLVDVPLAVLPAEALAGSRGRAVRHDARAAARLGRALHFAGKGVGDFARHPTQMNASVIDRFTELFTCYIDSGFGLLGGEVAFLASALIVIDVTLAGLFWACGAGEDALAPIWSRRRSTSASSPS